MNRYRRPYRTAQQHKTGQMNKTEKRFSLLLDAAIQAEEIERYEFERIKFRLAKNTYLTPDFYVVYPNHIEIIEIKGGFIREDAIIKFKVAAEMFPEYKWKLIQQKNKNSPFNLILEI